MKRILTTAFLCSSSLVAIGGSTVSANFLGSLVKKSLLTCLDYSFLYYVAKAGIFNGIVCKEYAPSYSLEENGVICKKIPDAGELNKNDDATTAYFKLDVKSASATKFSDTILISLGGNRANGYDTVYRGIDHGRNNFILPTAAVRYRYFRDSTHNFITRAREVSEKTIYEDGIRLYEYVTKVLGFKKVVLLGYSEGGSVASNLAKYIEDSGNGDSIRGIILASPIDGIKSSAEKYTGSEALGNLTATLLRDEKLDTFYNLSSLKNKNIPMLLVSGGKKDFLSLKLTHIDERLRKVGFTNVISVINNNYNHNDDTFDIEQIKLNDDTGNMEVDLKKLEEYLKIEGSPWECFVPSGQRMMLSEGDVPHDAGVRETRTSK